MDTLEALRTRRSHRRFVEGALTEEQLETLKRVALSSPTAMNRRDTRFLFVTRRETLKDLAGRMPNARFLGNAALAVVVMARRDGVGPVEDTSIAAAYMQLAAHAMGLGSCWGHVERMPGPDGRPMGEIVAEAVPVPEGYFVECIVGVGHFDPAEPGQPCGERAQNQDRISELR